MYEAQRLRIIRVLLLCVLIVLLGTACRVQEWVYISMTPHPDATVAPVETRSPIIPVGDTYELITPTDELFTDTLEYMDTVQSRASSGTSLFVPTGVGAVIAPDGQDTIFSGYGATENEVYSLPSQEGDFMYAETSGVLFCGVVSFETREGYIFLAHAGAPDRLGDLFARGIQEIQSMGGTTDQLRVTLYTNPNHGHDSYLQGEQSYEAELRLIAGQLGLDIDITEQSVSSRSSISE